MRKGTFAAKSLPISVGAGVPGRPAVVCFLFRERQANSEFMPWLSLRERQGAAARGFASFVISPFFLVPQGKIQKKSKKSH